MVSALRIRFRTSLIYTWIWVKATSRHEPKICNGSLPFSASKINIKMPVKNDQMFFIAHNTVFMNTLCHAQIDGDIASKLIACFMDKSPLFIVWRASGWWLLSWLPILLWFSHSGASRGVSNAAVLCLHKYRPYFHALNLFSKSQTLAHQTQQF